MIQIQIICILMQTSFVENNLLKYFKMINENDLIIEYKYNKTGYWSDIKI